MRNDKDGGGESISIIMMMPSRRQYLRSENVFELILLVNVALEFEFLAYQRHFVLKFINNFLSLDERKKR